MTYNHIRLSSVTTEEMMIKKEIILMDKENSKIDIIAEICLYSEIGRTKTAQGITLIQIMGN
ncbi:MAG: hypothetical protein GX799_03545 [Crenarchaeota archaeon]|nr:hypothetical protein [Thermoproteota archaeon]